MKKGTIDIAITDTFLTNRNHGATDIVYPSHKVINLLDGKVIKVHDVYMRNKKGERIYQGKEVIVQSGNVTVGYLHLDTVSVNINDSVKQGDHIGTSLTTYGGSTGPHVHLTLYIKNRLVDSAIILAHLQKRGVVRIISLNSPYKEKYEKFFNKFK
jgi:murein DD-endopeptidase MepM/ murein hydrolase activator NlpD